VAPDERRVSHVRPLARGVIEDIPVSLGARVALLVLRVRPLGAYGVGGRRENGKNQGERRAGRESLVGAPPGRRGVGKGP